MRHATRAIIAWFDADNENKPEVLKAMIRRLEEERLAAVLGQRGTSINRLRGMGTAFASSLLGLGGSLVLGFLELQASHAHSRFYNQLEEWLSGITELAPAGSQTSDYASRQLYAAIHDMHRAVLDLNERVGTIPRADGAGAPADESVRELAKGVDQLVRQMRAEQKVVREWVDEQAAQQSEVATVLKELAASVPRKG